MNMTRDKIRNNGVEAAMKEAGSHDFSLTYNDQNGLAEELDTGMNDP